MAYRRRDDGDSVERITEKYVDPFCDMERKRESAHKRYGGGIKRETI